MSSNFSPTIFKSALLGLVGTFLYLHLFVPSMKGVEADWVDLFNGKNLSGWKANLQPDSFKVVDGVIRAQSTKDRVHLFYMGEGKDGTAVRFKNFELKATVRGEPNANSGIFFHTDTSVRDVKNHLAKGYEVQLNSNSKEKRKTGSLYRENASW
jgi:hypothetical protein